MNTTEVFLVAVLIIFSVPFAAVPCGADDR